MQVSQSKTLYYLQSETQPCRCWLHILEEKVRVEAGSQTWAFLSLVPAVTFPSYHKHPRPCVFSSGLIFYLLLAHGLETSIGQRG